MSENMKYYNMAKTVPENAKKPIGAGRTKDMTNINCQWRIEKLTEMFGPVGIGWYTQTTNKEIIEGANGEKKAFVDILLFVKIDGEWSKGIEGDGGSSFIAKESTKMYTSDECFKMAKSDAISVACKLLGIGADIYRGIDDSKYSQYQPNTNNANTKANDNKTDNNTQKKDDDKPEYTDAIYKVLIFNTLYKVFESNKADTENKLEELTAFKTKDGKEISGVKDVRKLSSIRLKCTYGKIKKMYEKELEEVKEDLKVKKQQKVS